MWPSVLAVTGEGLNINLLTCVEIVQSLGKQMNGIIYKRCFSFYYGIVSLQWAKYIELIIIIIFRLAIEN